MRKFIDHLEPLGYTGWRSIRGDGNCYYRAIMVGIFETLFEGQKDASLIVAQLTELQPQIESLYGSESGHSHVKLIDSLLRTRMAPSTQRWTFFECEVLRVTELDLALVRCARCLVGTYLVRNESAQVHGITIGESILALCEDVTTIEAYCARYVFPLGVDAEGTLTNLDVLSRSLGCKSVTVLVNATETDNTFFPSKERSSKVENAEDNVVDKHQPHCQIAPLRLYSDSDHANNNSESPAASKSPPLFRWISSLFGEEALGDFKSTSQDLFQDSPQAVDTVHLLLRAGNGMGEGHYDLLYLESAPIVRHFRKQGSRRLFLAKLPVPPLLVPNHVHSVGSPPQTAAFEAGSSSISPCLTLNGAGEQESDSEDTFDALGSSWEFVNPSEVEYESAGVKKQEMTKHRFKLKVNSNGVSDSSEGSSSSSSSSKRPFLDHIQCMCS